MSSRRQWLLPGVDAPLLRVPPFPNASPRSSTGQRESKREHAESERRTGDLDRCLGDLTTHRLGGSFWAGPAHQSGQSRIVLRPAGPQQALAMIAAQMDCSESSSSLLWLPDAVAVTEVRAATGLPVAMTVVTGDCDPWMMLKGASGFVCDARDSDALIANLLGTPITLWDEACASLQPAGIRDQLVTRHLLGYPFIDPFTGRDCSLPDLLAIFGLWRRMIDANHDLVAAAGFGRWKQRSVAALLWNGRTGPHFIGGSTWPASEAIASGLSGHGALALWKARVSPRFLKKAEASTLPLYEVEDGFIRSSGLGANCVPPLSILVDPLGPHYDPARASTLETLIEAGQFSGTLLARAQKLRQTICALGLSKYQASSRVLERPAGSRLHILVPGQVEDDRSVRFGGIDVKGNLGLLQRVRAANPEAYILYKPHPDVEAGHRQGHIPEADVRVFADDIVCDQPITALIAMVDEVHVLTSLAGFEALMREKTVVTHGTPFYAGWGLTTDLAPPVPRRTRRASLDELVAAALILYPRYLDPETGLPCPPEVLVDRLGQSDSRIDSGGTLVALRRLQGKARRSVLRMFAA